VRVALLAALLGALNPFLVYYSQEARMYSLLATASAASFWMFAEWWRGQGLGIRDWRLSAGYCLTTALGLYTHYAFGFVIIAQTLIVLIKTLALSIRYRSLTPNPQSLTKWLIIQFFTFLLFIPWLPIAYRQLTGWPAAREFPGFTSALLDLTRYLAFGRTIATNDVWLGLAAVGLLLLLSLWKALQHPTSNIQLLSWLLIPAAITLSLGLLTEPFAKFLLVAVPPLCLLLAEAIGRQPSVISHQPSAISHQLSAVSHRASRLISLISFLSLVSLISFSFLSLNNLYFYTDCDDYRGIARYIEDLNRPGGKQSDGIILNAPNQFEAFSYYHRAGAPVYPLPTTRPLEEAPTEAALNDIVARHDRLFVLYWAEAQADPERFIESWLAAHTFKAGDQWFGGVRLATYAAARPASEIATPMNARFGDDITLEGYTLQRGSFAPGDIVQLTLFWHTDAVLAERYKVFVHLSPAFDQPPLAQADGEPGGGLMITTAWQLGQQVIDNHGVLVPPDLPPGQYRLIVGVYNLFDPEARLPIRVGDTIAGDRLDLGAITIQ
jgi:hypothetical protein